MMKLAEVIKQEPPYLAEWVTREQGKPLGGVGPDQVPGARFELWGCEVWTQVPASLDLPVDVAFEDDTRRDEVHRKPFGVVAAIAPWNWPLLIAIWQIIPSIRAGNTVVIKPSEYTTIGTLELVRLIGEVLPPGVVNTVSGPGEVGAWLAGDPGIDKIMFTGSGPPARRSPKRPRKNLVPTTTMELGGNDAAIMLPGCRPEGDGDGPVLGRLHQHGPDLRLRQAAVCAREPVRRDRGGRSSRISPRRCRWANGMDEGMVMGPIQNRMQYDKVVSAGRAAQNADGGTIVCGGQPTEAAPATSIRSPWSRD
jgi:acyl-CoA reductase-like NAD-dependent aldehyde dehydrogenase